MKLVVRSVLWFVLLLAPAVAGAADLAVPFRKLTLEEATAAAGKEGKLVFIDFYTTWCEPCKRLDADTFSNADVGKLVGEAAVPLKLDAEKEGRPAAQRYKVQAFPTLLLIKADGSEVDRIVGYREPAQFTADFKKLLDVARTGKTPLERAREAVARVTSPTTPSEDSDIDAAPRFELAKQLVRNAQFEEALRELMWCWDEGKKDPEFARMMRSQVPRELGRLAREFPAAREAIVVRRDQARERALANKGGSTTVQDLIALNRELKEDEDTLAVFDRMPEGDRRKVTISIYLFDLLVEKKRYKDALLFGPLETQLMQIERARAQMKSMSEKAGDQAGASFLKYVRTSSAKRVEAMAGAGRTDDAKVVAEKLLELDPSDETKQLLREHLERAGKPDLLKL